MAKDFQLSTGRINVTEFTSNDAGDGPANLNIRDTHINDAFRGLQAWAWTDNHNVSPTANILNVFVRIGKKGKLRRPIQLTDFSTNTIAFDTSITINRGDQNNIVVSYNLVTFDSTGTILVASTTCRAVSFDGGKSWGGVFDGVHSLPQNGLIDVQFTGGTGDNPGVMSDKFGNIWYGTAVSEPVNLPTLLVSTDKGLTFTTVPTFNGNDQPNIYSYDYPHLTFGGGPDSNGNNTYGVWWYSDVFLQTGDIIPGMTFTPISGVWNGDVSTQSLTYLNEIFCMDLPSIAAAPDGRFWGIGVSNFSIYNCVGGEQSTLFKSPGPIDSNYACPWLGGVCNAYCFRIEAGIAEQDNDPYKSVPFLGMYGFVCITGLIYDAKVDALYLSYATRTPSLSQNCRIFFVISRNNGQTWSRIYDISSSVQANRGLVTMAQDEHTGDIYFGWYDGRHDPSQKTLQYFGARIDGCKLRRLVEKIPKSNPIYQIPGQGSPCAT